MIHCRRDTTDALHASILHNAQLMAKNLIEDKTIIYFLDHSPQKRGQTLRTDGLFRKVPFFDGRVRC